MNRIILGAALAWASACGGGHGGPCAPTRCAAAGKDCGSMGDGCGNVLECGSCAAPLSCGGGGEANLCGEGECLPTTCLAEGKDCGILSDGCAAALDCGSCEYPQTCGGGGIANLCGSGGGGGDPDAGAGGGGGPRILMLTTNTALLRSDQVLLVTAVVTDPDGVDDLIGGTLLDPTSGGAYGAFATSAAEGAYQVDLTWADLDTVRPIDAPPSGAERRFLARFFDTAGGRAEAEVAVTLRCAGDGLSACAGECFDLATDSDHCGACDRALSGDLICRDGEPDCIDGGESACGDECFDLTWSHEHCGSCANDCADFEAEHGLDDWASSCTSGTCTYASRSYEATALSCATLCGRAGLTCATVYVPDDFYCPGGGGTGVGCAYYETPSCGHAEPIDSCAEVVSSSWIAEPGWCDEGTAYPRSTLTCYCSDGDSSGCAGGAENTPAACSDGCSNDGDPYVDCDDFNCCGVVDCPADSACG